MKDLDIIVDPKQNKSLPAAASFLEKQQYIKHMGLQNCNIKFNELNDKKVVNLGKYDPTMEHLTVCRGLNLRGKCQNKNCLAYKHQKTWISLGYGKFSLGKDRFGHTCRGVGCGQPISGFSVQTMGFTRAIIKIKGIILVNNKETLREDVFEELNGQLAYFENSKDNLAEWGYLDIEAIEPKDIES